MPSGSASLVAGARIGNTLGWWMVPREALVAAHVQLAAVGFGTLLVMGIGSRLLPMFLLSRTAPEWPRRWSAPLTGTGVLLQATGWLGGVSALVVLGGALAGTGVALFLWQAALWFRHRARPQLDPSLRQVVAALTLLGAALLAGVGALVTGRPQFVAAYGLLLIVGWLGVLVAAIYARIVPFLTWMHRYSPRVGEKGLPEGGRPGSGAMGPDRLDVLDHGHRRARPRGRGRGPVRSARGAALFASGTLVSLVLYARLALRP